MAQFNNVIAPIIDVDQAATVNELKTNSIYASLNSNGNQFTAAGDSTGINHYTLTSNGTYVYWSNSGGGSKFGHRNFITNGNFEQGWNYWEPVGTVTYPSYDNGFPRMYGNTWMRFTAAANSGLKQYFYCVSALTTDKVSIGFDIYGTPGYSYLCKYGRTDSDKTTTSENSFSVQLTETRQHFSKTVDWTPSFYGADVAAEYFYLQILNNNSAEIEFYITNVKVENGDIPTDWTPSIEDLRNLQDAGLAHTGRNLSEIVPSIEAMLTNRNRIDMLKAIKVGDYYPITLNGSFYDYGAKATKTINTTLKMQVAAINPYTGYGETASDQLVQKESVIHYLFMSQELLPVTVRVKSAAGSVSGKNNWTNSDLYNTLNNESNGVYALLAAAYSEITAKMVNMKEKTYCYNTSYTWVNRGKLFLPLPFEIFPGYNSYPSGTGKDTLNAQWSIFSEGIGTRIKKLGNDGSKSTWWIESDGISSSMYYAVDENGGLKAGNNITSSFGVPICFLLQGG